MPGDLLIRRARVVLPDRSLPEADVLIQRGTIARVCEEPIESVDLPALDAGGLLLMPGLVDIHCDAIEKEAQPRPGVRLAFELALRELDRKLALCGITTMYHGVSFGAGEGVRDNETAAALVPAIAAGAADVLCSDYYPAGLLLAVFDLVADGVLTLPAATALATANAAAAVGLGRIAGAVGPGWRADLLLVSADGDHPTVEATIVAGRVVLTTSGPRASATSPTASSTVVTALPRY